MSKTKEQIISDYDSQNILSYSSSLIGILGIIIALILEIFFSKHYGFFIFAGCIIIAIILRVWTGKCPICDKSKKRTQLWYFEYHYEDGCENCKLSEQEIIDYVESLIKSKK